MIIAAFMLAFVELIACILVFLKLPGFIRQALVKLDLFTIFGTMTLSLILIGTTATALISIAFLGIMVAVAVKGAKKGWFYELKDFWQGKPEE